MTPSQEKRIRKELEQRLGDIYAGATGDVLPDGEDSWLTLSDYPRVISAIERRLFTAPHSFSWEYLLEKHNAAYFESIPQAVDHLFHAYARMHYPQYFEGES